MFYLFKKLIIILVFVLMCWLFLEKYSKNWESKAKKIETNFIIYLALKRYIPDDEIDKYALELKGKIESLDCGKIEVTIVKNETKDSMYYIEKFFEKVGSALESLASGFASVMGGYAANKLISKIENNPGSKQAQD